MFALFNTARKVIGQGLALVGLVALSACDDLAIGGAGGGGPSIDTSKPVPVALLVPGGSGQAGDDVLAKNLENAARLAMADLNGVSIDLRVYNTAGNAGTAAAQANQAVADGAKIILGPVYAEAANAVGVTVADKGINVLSFSNNPTIAGGNVFVMGPTFDNTARRLAKFAAGQGKKNVLVVHSTDVPGQLGRAAIEKALGSTGGIKSAGAVSYPLSQQGVVGAISSVKAAVQATGADTIFTTATTAGALPLFSQLLPEAGITPATVQSIGLTRWDIPAQTLELPGVQGGWFALPDPAMTQQYASRYSAAYGESPHPISGLAYDGIAAIGALVSAGKSNALTGAALTQKAGFQGVTGAFRLRPDGTNDRALAIATIQNKQVQIIDAAPRSFAGAGF